MSFPVMQSQGSLPAAWNPAPANAVRRKVWPATPSVSNVVWVNFQRKAPKLPENSPNAAAHLSALAFKPVFDELDDFEGLVGGWDGPGSVPASSEALSAARKLVREFSSWAVVPEVSLAPDGEISVYWNAPGSYVDVSFQRTGRASIYARIDGNVYKSDSPTAADLHVPTPVMSHLAPL